MQRTLRGSFECELVQVYLEAHRTPAQHQPSKHRDYVAAAGAAVCIQKCSQTCTQTGFQISNQTCTQTRI
jgi:hypothetical protein